MVSLWGIYYGDIFGANKQFSLKNSILKIDRLEIDPKMTDFDFELKDHGLKDIMVI